MKADGRCDKCGVYVAVGWRIKRGKQIYHEACAPSRRRAKRNPYDGTRPKEEAKS